MEKFSKYWLLILVFLALAIFLLPQSKDQLQTTSLKEDKSQIVNSLKLAKNWFSNNINPQTKILQFQYDPLTDSYSENNNHIRQLGTLWAMTDLKLFLKDGSLNDLINDTLDYYLRFKVDHGDYSFLSIDNSSPLAFNAFLILALLNTPDYPQKDKLLSQFSQGILVAQNSNGSFDTFFNSARSNGQDYYPGEAMLALMKLYQPTKNSLFLNSVIKAFPYYREYFRNNKNTAFVAWQTQAYFLAFKETKNPDLAEFIFEMNDWLIDNYQSGEGGFPKDNPSSVTFSYLEGINDAYSLALLTNDDYHKRKFANSIKIGTDYVFKTQLTGSSNIKNPQRAIGGFKHSLTDSRQRIDYTQHAVSALIKAFRNKIFP